MVHRLDSIASNRTIPIIFLGSLQLARVYVRPLDEWTLPLLPADFERSVPAILARKGRRTPDRMTCRISLFAGARHHQQQQLYRHLGREQRLLACGSLPAITAS